MQIKLSIGAQLTLAEQQLEAAVQCLNTGDTQALTQASEALQATAIGLVKLMHIMRLDPSAPEFNIKIGQLAQRLIALRENLLRRSALVDRALQIVIPGSASSTYQPIGPYGSGPRASGSMSAYSA